MRYAENTSVMEMKMFNPKKRILAWLLHNANTNPVFIYKNEFYKIKDTILRKHGTDTGLYDFQHIQKECWTCNGTGIYPYPSIWGKECMKCDGTGWYSDRWNRLDIWQFGKYEFHQPVSTIYRKTLAQLYLTANISPRNIIDDYISHRATVWSSDSCLILFLLYAPKLFWRAFGKVGFGRKTPVSFLFSLGFKLRLFWKKLVYKRDQNIPF